ncbi:MAG: helix-turn-helix transcriptional regulator [Clostridiales bacterium]|nr:helix-turn-helix transcriptional regulator [Clostridiales bacterium]
MEVFAERLKEVRNERKMSAFALSKVLGVSHSTIIRWESGTILPSIEHLYNIAKYFGVTADYLIGLED